MAGAAGRPAKMSGEFDNVGRICYNKNAIFRKDVLRPARSRGKVFSEGRRKGEENEKDGVFQHDFWRDMDSSVQFFRVFRGTSVFHKALGTRENV